MTCICFQAINFGHFFYPFIFIAKWRVIFLKLLQFDTADLNEWLKSHISIWLIKRNRQGQIVACHNLQKHFCLPSGNEQFLRNFGQLPQNPLNQLTSKGVFFFNVLFIFTFALLLIFSWIFLSSLQLFKWMQRT